MAKNPKGSAPKSEADPITAALDAARKMKCPALRLTLPGAPMTPHHMPGLAGLYRPDVPTPVGGAGELPLEAAVRASMNPSLHVELVDCKNPERAREQNAADRTAARDGIAAAVRDQAERLKADPDAAPTETDRINDELKAVGL
jgi:hypothetical protein